MTCNIIHYLTLLRSCPNSLLCPFKPQTRASLVSSKPAIHGSPYLTIFNSTQNKPWLPPNHHAAAISNHKPNSFQVPKINHLIKPFTLSCFTNKPYLSNSRLLHLNTCTSSSISPSLLTNSQISQSSSSQLHLSPPPIPTRVSSAVSPSKDQVLMPLTSNKLTATSIEHNLTQTEPSPSNQGRIT
ncbi:hypothetical protein M0R45_019302 [Rubus argutus]|uniref:Uncharacterized protein n=1 Tax=Rubus argutus TaxID=59490 RepID=A0AAW1X7F3_RUBAR